MVALTRFILFCAAVLALPGISAAQPPGSISHIPEGKAPILIVWVHGCCTDKKWVDETTQDFSTRYATLLHQPTQYEIVVFDWTRSTPNTGNIISDASTAYNNALPEAQSLADAIIAYHTMYKHIHLIGHSAGANLIHHAATIVATTLNTTEKPLIHLTFLDAYTPDDEATKKYGCTGPALSSKSPCLPTGYPYYAEHYVDIGLVYTDAFLPHAFNFDITNWTSRCSVGDLWCRHQWPLQWYIKSILFTEPYKYGHLLSLEGGNQFINEMGQLYPAGGQFPKNNAELTLTYPTPPEWPGVAGVEFPSSVDGNGAHVSGTIYFIDTNGGINLARLDVLGDTCGKCFTSSQFDPGVPNETIGQFPFYMYCTTDTGFYWAIKLTIADIQGHTSSPYTFSVHCKPV